MSWFLRLVASCDGNSHALKVCILNDLFAIIISVNDSIGYHSSIELRVFDTIGIALIGHYWREL